MTITTINKMFDDLMNTTYSIETYQGIKRINPVRDLGYSYGYSKRAKRRLGVCKIGKKRIELSSYLVELNTEKVDVIKDTILHEIAHAIAFSLYGYDGGADHGPKWQRIAKSIGCDGKRLHDNAETPLKQPKSKYTLVCTTCDNQIKKHRKPTRRSSCAKCDSSGFNNDYILEIRQNY